MEHNSNLFDDLFEKQDEGIGDSPIEPNNHDFQSQTYENFPTMKEIEEIFDTIADSK